MVEMHCVKRVDGTDIITSNAFSFGGVWWVELGGTQWAVAKYCRAEKFMDHAACSNNISNRIFTHFPVELIQIEIIYSNIINLTCYTRFCFCC